MAMHHSEMSRLIRSALYMPASNPRVLSKSLTLRQCDAFIYDLEDAVGVDLKPKARKDVEAFLLEQRGRLAPHQMAVVRVNGNTTAFYEGDVETCERVRPDAVLLPKAESREDVERLRGSLGGDRMEVWCMIETPLGVLNAKEIAQAADTLVMGTVDLANDLKCSVDPALARAPLMASLQMTVLAARAANIRALDGVYTSLDDDEGFAREAKQGLELGFDGKTLVHPRTIDRANEVFSPSPEAVARARRIVEAYAQGGGGGGGGGAISVDGKLVEELHVRRARALLDMHEALLGR